jgi:hypothetical protein
MIDKELLERERLHFQCDTLDGQLARLRSSLDIIATRIAEPSATDLVKQAIDQTAWFCEWAFSSTEDDETRLALVECGRMMARCRNHWSEIAADPAARREVAAEAARWSERLLGLFGLLKEAS